MHRFSFIIPCHNSEKTLENCIESINNLVGLKEFEIIVVINNCKDQTESIARKHSNLVFTENQKGAGATRNAGAIHAKYEWLVFIDSDIILDQYWLQNSIPFLNFNFYNIFSSKIIPKAKEAQRKFGLDRFRFDYARFRTKSSFCHLETSSVFFPVINSAACIYHRDLFHRTGGFESGLLAHEDTDCSVRAFYKGANLCVLKESIAYVSWSDGFLNYLKRSWKHGREAKLFFFIWNKKSSSLFRDRINVLRESNLNFLFYYYLSQFFFLCGYFLSMSIVKDRQILQVRQIRKHLQNLIIPIVVHSGQSYALKVGVRLILRSERLFLVSLDERKQLGIPLKQITQREGILEVMTLTKNQENKLFDFLFIR